MLKEFIYQDATSLVTAISEGALSSRELLEAQIEQIHYYNKLVNSCVSFNYEQARLWADKADLAVKENINKLHGLPITLKDAFKVKGMTCTDGNPLLKNYIPAENAKSVDKLLRAGVIPFAKTNVPFKCSDIQTYNKIYGTSNNPWNLLLTPGGSSGGAAAALAMGFTSLELGSDIGGSIRIPSHFCGIYGHKTTHGIISFNGHILNDPIDRREPDLAVIGPMARSARDLELMIDILVQPDSEDFYKFELKKEVKDNIQEFKVLFWMDDESCPIEARMKRKYQQLLNVLKQENVKVDVGRPKYWDFDEIYHCYASKLSSQMSVVESKIYRMSLSNLSPAMKALNNLIKLPSQVYGYAEGADLSYRGWVLKHEYSLRLKEKCLKIFDEYDIIICPPVFTLAFEHNHKEPMPFRKLIVEGEERFYLDLFKWIAPASVLGIPATSAPIGLSEDLLPVSIQILARPYADKVSIKFAELLSRYMGGFEKPPLVS